MRKKRTALPYVALTQSEIRVLQHKALGLNTQEISEKLRSSQRYVRQVSGRVRLKLFARNDAHAVALAMALGILDPHTPSFLTHSEFSSGEMNQNAPQKKPNAALEVHPFYFWQVLRSPDIRETFSKLSDYDSKMTNREIAARMNIARETLRTHLRKLREDLGVSVESAAERREVIFKLARLANLVKQLRGKAHVLGD